MILKLGKGKPLTPELCELHYQAEKEVDAEMKAMSISANKVGQYMREWMDLKVCSMSYSSLEKCAEFYATAKDRQGIEKSYKIDRVVDSAGQYNVWVRPLGSSDDWEWVDAISEEAKFSTRKMERFLKSESLLDMVFKDLSSKNPKSSKADILETIFNSYVLDDSAMVREYNKA